MHILHNKKSELFSKTIASSCFHNFTQLFYHRQQKKKGKIYRLDKSGHFPVKTSGNIAFNLVKSVNFLLNSGISLFHCV